MHMKLKVVKPLKDGNANPGARTRANRVRLPAARAQDLGDRRLQLLLGAKPETR
jgi:hypothetical protein